METSTLLEDAEQSYAKSLLASGQAMNYMLARGFGGAIAARYRVGFAAYFGVISSQFFPLFSNSSGTGVNSAGIIESPFGFTGRARIEKR